MSEKTSGRYDAYRAVTDSIIAALEAGAGVAECPWHRRAGTGLPANALTTKCYRGVNIVALWASAAVSAYSSNLWATFRQWKHLGAHVRRGEHASTIVFYKKVTSEKADDVTGETKTVTRLVARASRVFNADQVDDFRAEAPERPNLVNRIAAAETLVANSRAEIHHGSTEAYYLPAKDRIYMPHVSDFIGTATSSPTESYYGVLLHELVHWTGAPHRLERDLSARFGESAYAMEELVAELGAAFLCAQLEITPTPRLDHAAYIASWLKVLKSDKRAVFSAATKAAQAVDCLSKLYSTQSIAA